MKILIPLAFLLLLSYACGVPKNGLLNAQPNHYITVGQGPEDMALDTFGNVPRILVSCDSRRESRESGWIYCIDLNTERTYELKRTNEPSSLVFHPHGMDLVKNKNSAIYLYLVSHDDVKNEQAILQYQLIGTELRFTKKYTDSLLISPNDVCATSDGLIFTGNEFHKRNVLLPALFGMKTGNFIRFENDSWSVQSKGYCYANGLAVYKNQLLTVGTRNKYLYASSIHAEGVSNKEKIARVSGADNMMLDGNFAYVACHVKPFRFLKHAKNPKNSTPTVVYAIDLETHKKKLVYSNNDAHFNGASTALYFNGKLYLSQVFEPTILVVDGIKRSKN